MNFREILNRMLDKVSNRRDKRQGAIIYDTLAPFAAEIVGQNITVDIYKIQSRLISATGQDLDNWAENFQIFRYPATFAVKIAEFTDTSNNPFNPPLGSRFSTIDLGGNLIYRLIEQISAGQALLECEVSGVIGNSYIGRLLPIDIINNLETAEMIGTHRPAQDIESDELFRQRIIDNLNEKPFGGNIADYKRFVGEIEGIGAVKVFPIWDGGGTVKISILDGELNSAVPEFIDIVQTAIDPLINQGQGIGQAPIGHSVTVATADEIGINIEATVILRAGFVLGQVTPLIKTALEYYIKSLKNEWANSDSLWIFLARVISVMMNVDGVNNVLPDTVLINGLNHDFELPQTKFIQQIPKLGSVVINDA